MSVSERSPVRALWAGGARAERPPLVREILLILTLFVAYRLGRTIISGQDASAYANAWQVWHLERTLGLPDEETFQDWALNWPAWLRAANWYYVGVHFPLTLGFLAWGWLRRPPADYRWARRLIITLTGLAMFVHVLMPLAPPRMMGPLGFVDTMAVLGPSAYGPSTGTVANQLAAMPSLHVGWALLLALVVIRTTRTRWRWLALIHPLVTTIVVVATGNHYWVDAVVAGLLLGVALLVTPRRTSAQPDTGITMTGSVVGADEPPLGSTVNAIDSPSATSATNCPTVPSPRRSSTPADCGPPSSMTHS